MKGRECSVPFLPLAAATYPAQASHVSFCVCLIPLLVFESLEKYIWVKVAFRLYTVLPLFKNSTPHVLRNYNVLVQFLSVKMT